METVGNYPIVDFLIALRDFVAGRGRPRMVFSDNTTNYKATARILRRNTANDQLLEYTLNYNADTNISSYFAPRGSGQL